MYLNHICLGVKTLRPYCVVKITLIDRASYLIAGVNREFWGSSLALRRDRQSFRSTECLTEYL
jgi:hypothetical protein